MDLLKEDMKVVGVNEEDAEEGQTEAEDFLTPKGAVKRQRSVKPVRGVKTP